MIMESTMSESVVITGASSGIGEACALHLASLGWQVFAGVRKQVDGERLCRGELPQLIPICIDVTDHDSIVAAADLVAKTVGSRGLRGLINNAGMAIGGPLEFLPLADLRQQLEINVIGQIAVTQAFLPLLRQGRGRVINMSSISGRVATPFLGPYAASKFALEALTDSLRLELQPWRIEVISIEPGAIATPIWNKSLSRADEVIKALPDQVNVLYGTRLARLRERVNKAGQHGIPPAEVAKVVAKALLAKRPKTRYLVGRDAKMGALLISLLPDRWRDWLIVRQNGA
jgi:NAD(P)-dependent dehydrogenase (short-subunit alcohol dehydrogenase family)